MNEQTAFVISKLENPQIQTVLNIGYRYDSNQTIQKHLESAGKKFYVLEAWKENCNQLINQNICKRVYCGDCRHIDNIDKVFDAIIWLHGPEHVLWQEFIDIRQKIEQKAGKIVIYQSPIGEYPQGELYKNPYEKHVQTLQPQMFADLGYQTQLHNKNGEFTFSAYIEKP